jgi:translation initiation factor eIF-2B subunit gamma
MSTALEDSHVYVCKRSVLELLDEKPHFSSLREEFLPWLCRLQYRHSIPTRPKVGIVIHDKPDLAMRINTLQNFYEMSKRVCYAFSPLSVPCLRLKSKIFQILAGTTYSPPADPKDRSLIDQKAQISTDSIIGESTQISERTSIKKSVIGRHCIIGRMVKISGSVILDHCVIEEGCEINNGEKSYSSTLIFQCQTGGLHSWQEHSGRKKG